MYLLLKITSLCDSKEAHMGIVQLMHYRVLLFALQARYR